MRLELKRRSGAAELDMTPMIDMTFQLIIFFMLLMNYSEGDQDERIHLPASELAKPAETPFEAPITLQLTKTGSVILAGDELPLADVKNVLQREKQFLLFRAAKTEKSRAVAKATVIIRADADAKTGLVQGLIKTAQELGFEKFVLRAKQEEGT